MITISKKDRMKNYLQRGKKKRIEMFDKGRFPKTVMMDISPEPDMMDIQDMTKINKLYEERQKQRMEYEKKIAKMHYVTGKFLNYMRDSLGRLNTLIRFVYGCGNQTTIKNYDKIDVNLATKCHLLSQCSTTSKTINYYFCKPNIDFQTIQQILPYIKKNEIINIQIGINSTYYGNIIKFPGHVFNIIILPGNRCFWIQSYIYQYSIKFDEITIEQCNYIIELYHRLFINPINPIFSKEDDLVWRYLTQSSLNDYNGKTLVGTPKPTNYSQKFCLLHVSDLEQYLKYKHKFILQSAIGLLSPNNSITKKKIKLSFGNRQTRDSMNHKLNEELKNLIG